VSRRINGDNSGQDGLGALVLMLGWWQTACHDI